MILNEVKAVVVYGDGAFKVLEHGTYVLCQVTEKKILLSDLKYWSVERQEAYFDAEQSLVREKEINRG